MLAACSGTPAPASFNPLNRGGVIHTRRGHSARIIRYTGFNPLNRGGVIHTFFNMMMVVMALVGFNPLNRGGVIHTRRG